MIQIYNYNKPFRLESGAELPELQIAYHTFGSLNAERDNVIWVCHALTANSDVADWWPNTVVKGGFLDPEKYFVVCANILGSHYGTTGPLSVDPRSGHPYYDRFPQMTVRDMVQVHRILASHLEIRRVKLLIGSSLGGFQCMEWAIIDHDFAEKVALIATTPVSKPWAVAFNESQRMAIEADATYGDDTPDAGASGLAAARSIALLSYRGANAYDMTQADNGAETDPADPFKRRVQTYQQHQGNKLRNRFNAYSYYRLSRAVDAHDISRGRGEMNEVLKHFKPSALVVAITSDILFPPKDHEPFVDNIPDVEYHIIDSDFGHDGFLIEYKKLTEIITSFIAK